MDQAERYLRLYGQMKRWEKLPEAGGILDQDQRIMRVMDSIDMIVRDREKAGADDQGR